MTGLSLKRSRIKRLIGSGVSMRRSVTAMKTSACLFLLPILFCLVLSRPQVEEGEEEEEVGDAPEGRKYHNCLSQIR